MAKKKKNQHYVPEFYLKNWTIEGKNQIYVYDKKTKKSFLTNVNNVASERYFYDIDFSGILKKEDLIEYGLPMCDIEHLDDGQYIENYFANEIEGDFQNRISRIIERVSRMNNWELNNCYFVNQADKLTLSYHLAIQFIRVKSLRSRFAEESDCIEQILQDMGANPNTIEKYTVQDKHLPYLHAKMIQNRHSISELTYAFNDLTWSLFLNRTEQPFFTSDCPIGTQEHIHHPFLSMRGLRCKGVEAFFPLNPNIMLSMVDGDYHTHMKANERRICDNCRTENVAYYNSLQCYESERYIFSNTADFSIVDKIIAKNSRAFDFPRTEMNYGGKTYLPRNNK